MKSILTRLLMATMAVFLVTALAQSQTSDDNAAPPPPAYGHRHFGMGAPMMERFASKLDLTDAQKAQMKTIMQKQRPAMKPLLQQSRAIDEQLRQYVEGTYDEAKVRTLATQKAQIEAELTVQRTRVHNELYQVLTPDQQTQLKQMEATHQARMQQRMQERMNAAPPAPDQN
ncbi:MAG TPA: Spy/CpxP family protein refolding chaperone [Verrucomicrobiae bacterium]|nr:Spy/CpxP family protein refolding chaperone [Verrucomicrobiae bacterium]